MPFAKDRKINICMDRPICQSCGVRLAAINYIKNNTKHYRRQCDSCIRKKRKIKVAKPKWQSSGYKKKPQCDLCGFYAKHSSQTMVYHIDGNLNNTDSKNLRTVCLNCTATIQHQDLQWKPGGLEVDY